MLRGYAHSLPVREDEAEHLYTVARDCEEAAHRISLDDRDGRTHELVLFAYALFGVSGFAMGVVLTLIVT